MGYDAIVKEVFPDCIYQQCVLHAGKDAARIVRLSLPAKKGEEWKKRLNKRIGTLFKSKKIRQVKKTIFQDHEVKRASSKICFRDF